MTEEAARQLSAEAAAFVQNIREMGTAFQASRALLTAVELELFTVLDDERRTSHEVAEALGTNPRATDRLMNALVALGLLQKRNDRFSNTSSGARFLVRGKPDYLAGLAHSNNLWDTWSALTDTVRAGKPPEIRRIGERHEQWLRTFIAAMHWRARQVAPAIVGLIDLKGVSRVLDVGGGSGAFSMEFVRARSGVTAVVFDLPQVVPLSRGYIQSAGFGAQVEVVAGDYTHDDLGKGFDLAFLSSVIHSNSYDANRHLIRKASDALNPGGRVAVLDSLMNEDRSGPLASALFAINMLVGTEAGDTYTPSEVHAWMIDAGLADISRIDTPFGTSLMIGRGHG
jgi:SAM-dependent methyltransferase